MRANQRFRIVDTINNKVYRGDIESEDVLFFLDQNGNVHKREEKENKVIMGPVESHKPVYSLGITDMNDIEIFEGDIICEKYKEKDGTINPYYYVVKYDEELLCYGLFDYNNDFTQLGNHLCGITLGDISSYYCVVGNVYESDVEQYWKIDRGWHDNE